MLITIMAYTGFAISPNGYNSAICLAMRLWIIFVVVLVCMDCGHAQDDNLFQIDAAVMVVTKGVTGQTTVGEEDSTGVTTAPGDDVTEADGGDMDDGTATPGAATNVS